MALQRIKNNLKKISFINAANSFIKTLQQDKYMINDVENYKQLAKKNNIDILDKKQVAIALKERLENKNIFPTAKTKGNLNIFLLYSVSNWESVLLSSLKNFGDLNVFDWKERGFNVTDNKDPVLREKLNSELLEEIKKQHSIVPIDILVGYFTNKAILPKTLKEISKLGIIIINFNLDDKLWFRNVKNLVPYIDLNLTNVPDCFVKYFACGGLATFWPSGGEPSIHKPYDIAFKYDVSFIGKKYGWRPQFINKLKKQGITIATFGSGWGNKYLTNEEVVKLYSESRINLGFGGIAHSKKLRCIKGRDFEVTMSGGLYLTQHNPELALVYKVGEEILTYKDAIDCAKKIKYYLANPDEAEKIRLAGRKRALKEHTWENRFKDIFLLLKILKNN